MPQLLLLTYAKQANLVKKRIFLYIMTTWIKQQALENGFDLVGIAPAKQFKEHLTLKNWIATGKHASMKWLENSFAKRLDPSLVMPAAKSVIMCATNYNAAQPYSTEIVEQTQGSCGWISRYAWGEDYHQVLKTRFLKLCSIYQARFPENNFSAYTDTGPVSERVFAKHAGIGWIGKNTCLINTKAGSFLFLTAILTDLELAADQAQTDHCGNCTRCIEACPTNAIENMTGEPKLADKYWINSNKCIAYLTIEHRDEIDKDLQPKIGNNIFGCDICQDVCPWNKKSPRTSDPNFQARPGFFAPNLQEFKKKVETEYPSGFKNSPLKRAKKAGLLRNIEIALKNQHNK